MPTTPLISPAKPKTKQSHARSIIQQILAEPVEITKTASKQVFGSEPQSATSTGEWQRQTTMQKPQTGEQPAFGNQEDAAKKQRRDTSHYQAFQNELQEIRRIQKQRAQDLAELRAQEEQQKLYEEEQAEKKTQEGLIEPITRKARGMLGAIGLKRKQTQVEIQKTPSN